MSRLPEDENRVGVGIAAKCLGATVSADGAGGCNGIVRSTESEENRSALGEIAHKHIGAQRGRTLAGVECLGVPAGEREHRGLPIKVNEVEGIERDGTIIGVERFVDAAEANLGIHPDLHVTNNLVLAFDGVHKFTTNVFTASAGWRF